MTRRLLCSPHSRQSPATPIGIGAEATRMFRSSANCETSFARSAASAMMHLGSEGCDDPTEERTDLFWVGKQPGDSGD